MVNLFACLDLVVALFSLLFGLNVGVSVGLGY